MQQRVPDETRSAPLPAPRGPAHATSSLLVSWGIVCPEWAQGDRAKIIPRVIAIHHADEIEHPRDVFARDPELARRVVGRNVWRLQAACKAMRSRGVDGNWTYDTALHLAALIVLRREERLKVALEAACEVLESAPESADPTPEPAPQSAPMTFVAFQETREHVADVTLRLPHLDFGAPGPIPGHVYCGDLVITEGHGPGSNLFALQIGLLAKTALNLESLERQLWAFALAEGYPHG